MFYPQNHHQHKIPYGAVGPTLVQSGAVAASKERQPSSLAAHSCYNRITLGYRHVACIITVAIVVGMALATELNGETYLQSPLDTKLFLKSNSNNGSGGGGGSSGGQHQDEAAIVVVSNVKQKEGNSDNGSGVAVDDDDHDSPWPRLAWLMSFPNSGTSFTLRMIRHVSRKVTASNYGEENRDDNGNSVPVYENTTNGPFWIEPKRFSQDYSLPDAYVLTKTHCGGRCEKCGPSAYVENPHSFLNKCLSGTRVETNGNFSSGSTSSSMPAPLPEYKNVKYDASLVHKAVHLIRNPFDNIVSRFHLEHHALVKRNDTESLKSYPNSKQGFRAFCRMLDLKFSREEKHSRFIESDIRFAMKDIPCHGDFIRYVQWHNLAFVTTDDLTLPTLVLRYENYENRFNETVTDLLSFLQLEWKSHSIEFIKGKEYTEYFSEKERKAVEVAMKALSSSRTWKNVRHYFY